MPDGPGSHLSSLILITLILSTLVAIPPNVLSSAVQPHRSESATVEDIRAGSGSPKNRTPGIPTSGFWNNTQSLGLLPGMAPVNKTATRGAQLLGVPTSFSWNGYFGAPSYMTPVKNQASCGSCWDFASVGAMEAQYQIGASDPNTGIDLSEQNVLSCSGGSCSGWYIDWALEFLKNSGTPDEACNPYVGADRACGSGRCADYLSRTYRLTSWSRISTDATNIKNYLYTHGPVIVAMPVFSDFPWYDPVFWQYHFYSHTPSGQYAGHAVVIVGWDDQGAGTADYWIVKNSWGTTGGDVNSGYGGYFYMTQDPTTGFFGIYNEAYVVSDVTPPTITVTLTESPTAYTYRTTTTTTTSYASTLSVTSTVPTFTTVLLVPLTVTSTIPSTQYVSSTITTTVTSYTGTETLTSTVPITVVLIASTVTSTAQNTQYLTIVGSTTVTSYTDTSTITSTVVVPTTVVLVPPTIVSTVQSTRYLTSVLTTTVTSYTSTSTSTSTIPTVTTVVLIPSTVTSTIQSTQFLTSTATTTVTSYTATTTSTSTSVLYTTVTSLASAGASSHLAYLGFISLLAVMVGRRATAGKGYRIRHLTSHRGLLTASSLCSLSPHSIDNRDTILSCPMSLMEGRCSSN